MKKRSFALFLAVVLAVSLLAGCGSKEPKKDTANETKQEEQQKQENTKITVTDQAGNTVTLEKPAEKVVTCFYGTSYAMIALGLQDKVVGMEAKAEKRPIYGLAAPEMLELPNVGSMKEFNVEAAIELEPDLVLLPKKLQDTASTFQEVGIPVAICYPESQELLEEMLVMIATLCGEPEKADALIQYYDDTYTEISDVTKDLKEEDKPSVYMGGNSSYLQTAPKTMYQSTLIENAGGVNAAAGIEGDYWTEVSYEQLLEMNPDVIILPCESEYTVDDLKADAQLAEVTAVKNGAVYKMPSGFEAWDSCVPSGVLGVRWMLATIHSDLYSMDEMRDDAAEFYKEFYGFDVDKSLIQ